MFKLSLIALFFALTSADFGVVQMFGYVDISVFECYIQKDISLVASTVWDQAAGPLYIFEDSYTQAKTAGIPNYDAIIKINDVSKPEDICGETVNALPADFNGTVWITFYTLWNRAFEERTDYLDSVIKTCQQHGLKMGIYSFQKQWLQIFDDWWATSETIQSLPLFYADHDEKASFDKFQIARFGNWTAPTMKEFSGKTWGFCNSAVNGLVFF